jgi:four helix bundle protein
MSEVIKTFRDMPVYRDAFALQQEIFRLSKAWPKEEMYSLTDQIRRSARSIGANIAESWAKRRYPAHFKMKLTDSDAELQESLHWMYTANSCAYLDENTTSALVQQAESIGRQLGAILRDADSFCKRYA